MPKPVRPLTQQDTHRSVLRAFVAVAFLSAGAILAASNSFGKWSGGPQEYCTVEARTYLVGVFNRSLAGPYQLVLLAGLIAVPLHLTWVRFTNWTDQGRAAYDSFAAWGQTLFTSLGFLGTIMGVSMAVAGLEVAMSQGEPAGLICGLSTAFDTTFLGLTASIMLLLARRMNNLSGREP